MTFGENSVRIVRFGLMPVALAFLVSCQKGAFPTTRAQPDSGTAVFEEREVEAPQVFQYTGPGLWDGRPSFGGVWVSHPRAKNPERVIMVNMTNGKVVVGALFDRADQMPGPQLQLSSDAAAALGVLAGAPTQMKVTALRRETVQVSVPDEPGETEDGDEAGGVEATALAAIDAAEDTGEKAAATTKTAAETAAEPEAEQAAEPAPKPQETKAAAAKPAEPKPATGSIAAAASVPLPYIQVGFYSIESNAKSSAAVLEKAGLSARIVPTTSKGKSFWRVLAGPAKDRADLNKVLGTVRGLGFSDAYAVKG